MKKYYILVIILIIILLFCYFFINKNKNKSIKNIESFEFRYSNGYTINSDVRYTIKCNKNNCYLNTKLSGTEEENNLELSQKCLKNIENILNKYNVSSWNNFNKSNKYVMDGNSFSINIKMQDGKKISAQGYEKWPKYYKQVKEELDNIFQTENNNTSLDEDLKPIIYLYPEKEMDINVKLGYKEKILISYPNYSDGWNVTAYPNGNLIDKNTNKELYSLFWEGINTISSDIKEEGFIVSGDDIERFLEEKLLILGLNDREKEEFIIFWLPKLKPNKYNYIRFETIEEQNENMPLIITPKPDTLIRVNMEFKKVNKKINIREQKLKKIERNGFTVVEWGGTILK